MQQEKRKDIQVFMMSHRPVDYGLLDNSIVTPIECGASLRDKHVCDVLDNTGDNISDWNEFYLEDTAIYWIWKNVKDAKYKGQMQYRRRLDLFPYIDYDTLFQHYDAIVAEPLELKSIWTDITVEGQYGLAHCLDDLKLTEEIIKEKYPEYSEDYDKYIKCGSEILYSNGWILPSEKYDEYSEFLFDILKEWLGRMGFTKIEDIRNYVTECISDGRITCSTMAPNWRDDIEHAIRYQMRIGGSLAERIFTLYAFHNFKHIFYVPYIKNEGTFI